MSYNDKERNRDLARLIAFLERETLPFIAGGDFNLSQHSASYEQLAKLAKDSFRERGWGWGNTWYFDSSFPPLLRLDYLWRSDDLETVDAQLESRMGSDHLPLRASFAFQD